MKSTIRAQFLFLLDDSKIICLALCTLLFGTNSVAYAVAALPGDFNLDGIVSHADFSVLGDAFGSVVVPGTSADANGDGIVGIEDYALYDANYGSTASLPSILPFSVTSSATVSGNVQWTITLLDVNGALGGHLNFDTGGPNVLSAVGDPAFFDVKGRDWTNAIVAGITTSGGHAFAGRGTTLGSHPSDANLVFLTLITQGIQPTTLSISGEYGYLGQDYFVNQAASFVPEPTSASFLVIGIGGLAVFSIRRPAARSI